MQVEYLVRISLPDEGWDVNVLEEACWKTGREASQRLFLSALEQRDREVAALAEGEGKEKVMQYLTTRLGVIGFCREKVNQGNGEGCYPLDKAIGLVPRQETNLWVQKSVRALRQEEDRRWKAVFEDGEVFEGEGDEKEIVVTKMDATMLHSQEKGRKKLTVKPGVMY